MPRGRTQIQMRIGCRFLQALLLVTACFPPVPVRGQSGEAGTPQQAVLLTIRGEVEREVKLTARDLAKLPRRATPGKDQEGNVSTFEGYSLYDVLQLAGVTFGERLRGGNLSKYLLVDAADAYQVVFSLAELDLDFTDKVILLADRRDGRPLGEKEGPLRLVIPDEKKMARWVRQVRTLVIRRAENREPGARQ